MSRVQLLAHTVLTEDAYDVLDPDYLLKGYETTTSATSADHLAELAGRECYQSFDRPNEKTAANADYLANIIRQKHESVLAHASFTFRFTDVSRSLTHELIRSRFLAFSELSQRYMDMSDSYTVTPPLFRGDNGTEWEIRQHHAAAVELYDRLVERALARGVSRKRARQAARYVLPGGAETRIEVSGNVRAWRDFIAQRNTEHADDEIREVAAEVLRIIHIHAPNSVQDLMETSNA